ncbi:MAG: radical SAM protein [Tannerella sp.]|jgi:MoaA/NifB/PqqE/SkfB family radical SAM enzyme|nr:radical SAM protein [Tannerella sp.]
MSIKEYFLTFKAAARVLFECSPRIVWKFMRNFAMRSAINISRFEKRQRKGKPFFPAFIMISVTEACNLACSGCWISKDGKKTLSPEQLDGIIQSCKKEGSYFFGILGGEPLMYNALFDIFAKHSDCYFQLFTNGILLTDKVAKRLKKLGNVTPLLSIEGLETESDIRRGKDDVYRRTIDGLRACKRAKLIIGAAASICKSNFDELVNRNYLELLAKEGVHYLWYYIYRPVGAIPNPDNALSREQIITLQRFIVEQRRNAPLQIIDAYWDDKGRALCPAAVGISHHISPSGAVEFCPPLQMSKDFINENGSNLKEIFANSSFLADLRKLTAENSRGCIILENPGLMVDFLIEQGAIDTTSRETVLEEFRKMGKLPGHDLQGDEIPDSNIFYRLVKKNYFFGFGAYG